MNTDAAALERFRGAIGRLDPTRPPRQSEAHAWYVERPDGVERELTARLALEPTAHCAVVGPIGSGKSSLLLAVGRRLQRTEGIFTRYEDVARHTDLSTSSETAVLVALAFAVARALHERFADDPGASEAFNFWKTRAHGGVVYLDPNPGDDELSLDYDEEYLAGALRPTPQPFTLELRERLTQLAQHVRRLAGSTLVLLIDGLDRLPTVNRFEEVVDPLLVALKAAGIGAVVVSPWRSIIGKDRIDSDRRFGDPYEVGAVLTPSGEDDRAFADRVLKARAVRDFFTIEAVEALARFSGGLMRDFIQLAKLGVTNAWSDGGRLVSEADVRQAADRIGRSRLLGISDGGLAALVRLARQGHFLQRTEEEEVLVATGRVIQRPESAEGPRARVHPTLLPFVLQESSVSADAI